MRVVLGCVAVFLVGILGFGASSEAYFWQVATGTVFGYLGGILGAQIGAAVAQAVGVALVDGLLGPIFWAYAGYALGATAGAWLGVSWVGLRQGFPGDPLLALFGAGLGTACTYALASLGDWEWALRLAPPLAALGATLAFSWQVNFSTP